MLWQQGGFTFFYDPATGNLAEFDQTGAGQAYINGSVVNINSSNWQYNAATGYYQYLGSDGTWQDANSQSLGQASFQVAQTTGTSGQPAYTDTFDDSGNAIGIAMSATGGAAQLSLTDAAGNTSPYCDSCFAGDNMRSWHSAQWSRIYLSTL